MYTITHRQNSVCFSKHLNNVFHCLQRDHLIFIWNQHYINLLYSSILSHSEITLHFFEEFDIRSHFLGSLVAAPLSSVFQHKHLLFEPWTTNHLLPPHSAVYNPECQMLSNERHNATNAYEISAIGKYFRLFVFVIVVSYQKSQSALPYNE